MTFRPSLTARAGRWSATHRKAAIGGWVAFVIAAVVLGGLAAFTERGGDDGIGSSGRADRALDQAFPQDPEETVLVQSQRLASTDAAFRDTVADTLRRLRAQAYVKSAQARQTSRDGHSTLISVRLHDGDGYDEDAASRLMDTTMAAHPGFFVGHFGEVSLEAGVDEAMGEDMTRAETLSVPVTLVILLLAFGSLVAAVVPLGLALSAVAAAMGVVSGLSHLIAMDETVNSVILLVGLAVGIDYSLFYLRREREERAAGRDAEAALQAAAATSGRAVLVSGFTVMIAMAGMFLAGDPIFTGLAVGSIIVVTVTLLASVSVLPAVLSLLGDRVEKGRIPNLRRRGGDSRVWGFVLDRVLRRPAVALVLAGGALVALALPALGMHTALPGMDSVSDQVVVKRTYDRMQAAFPGGAQPATVVVQAGDVTAPRVRAAIDALHPQEVRFSADRRVAAADVPIAGDGTDERSERALEVLRATTIPAGLGALPGVRADVAGVTAGTVDFADSMRSRAPLVFAFVLGLAFVLLLITFRSIVIPIKAILLNLLSVGAAYGVLSLAYREPIAAWLPMFLFVILFGLSMDYHVFIVSRIRELRDAGMSTTDAVSQGIRSTAGVVTSAAAIMVAVFGAFATVSSLDMQQMGLGLAVAVLIDATVIRAVLLPAAMQLLGDWNWWLPRRFAAAARRPVADPSAAAA